jgi:hypothetical protein
MGKPAQSNPVHVAEVASPIDGSRKYTQETFGALERGAREKHGTLTPYKIIDSGVWEKREYLFQGNIYQLTERDAPTCWHPTRNRLDPVLRFPFSVYDFAAFILHGDGLFFAALNFDGRDDDSRFIDYPDADRLSEHREDGSQWDYAAEEAQLLRDAYWLRAQARDHFGLRTAEAIDDDIFFKAAAWLLEKNNLPHSTENIALEVVMAGEETAPTVSAPPPAKSLETPAIAAAFDGILSVDEEKWKKRLGDVAHHRWLLPARVSKSQAPKSATWCPIKLGELFLKKGADEAALKKAFSNHKNLKAWRDEWANLTRERNAFGS